jgi:hypothetical protein
MESRLKKEIYGVFRNMINGLRLLVFRRVSLNEFYVSHEQLILLTLLFSGIIFIGSFVLSLPNPEFSVYGIATLTTQLSFFALAAYFYAKMHNVKKNIISFYIMFLSIWPFFHLIWLIIGKSATFNYWEIFGGDKYYYIIINIWLAAVVVSSISRSRFSEKNYLILTLTVYVMVLALPLNYLTFGNFWNEEYNYEAEYESLNEENTYYKQFEFIENIRSSLLPQRQGISDIYFVGFGSYAYEDVFMKEVKYARKVLDDKYDTKGRSVSLINNVKTLDYLPLATKSNLGLILEHIGKLMDTDDDILFLYLTSHGSKNHNLSINMQSLNLNELNPTDLKLVLNKSGIKYRILLVSACYSGGFIEPLKDDYTLIFTAAAKNKTSFGCSNKNEFTYFGRAVFKENIEKNYNLINAFGEAIETIRKKENARKLTHSEPQLYIGNKIRKKLIILTREIEEYNRKKN